MSTRFRLCILFIYISCGSIYSQIETNSNDSNVVGIYSHGLTNENNVSRPLVTGSAIDAFEIIKQKAENGDLSAQYELGAYYLTGTATVPQDLEKAVYWIKKAAEKGYLNAQLQLAMCSEYGQGVPQSIDDAVFWYKQAAEQGNATAQNSLGALYYNRLKEYDKAFYYYTLAAKQNFTPALYNAGYCKMNAHGTEKDAVVAIKYWRQAIEQNNYPHACYALANEFVTGTNIKANPDSAFLYFEKAAIQGHELAMLSLALCHSQGKGTPKNMAEAENWLKKTIEQHGNAIAMASLANIYENKPSKREEAFELYKKSAEAGYMQATVNLGNCYLQGIGTKRNQQEAFKCFSDAANNGNAYGQFCLGMCYRNGNGIPQNELMAIKWLKKSAAQNTIEAQYQLAVIYSRGTVAHKNEKEAFSWMKKAANQNYLPAVTELGQYYQMGIGTDKQPARGTELIRRAASKKYAPAQYALGMSYLNGIGVAQDKDTAIIWLKKASAQGNSEAKQILKRIK